MAECVICGGELVPLGSLGKKQWFRCRNCGMDQSSESQDGFLDRMADELTDEGAAVTRQDRGVVQRMVSGVPSLSPKIQAFEDWLDRLSEKHGVSTSAVARILMDEGIKSVDDVTFNEADSVVENYLT